MQKIVLATGNAGKVTEIQAHLVNQDITVVPQSEWSVPEVPETGLTFVENALIKARHAAGLTGLPSLADDSGLVVHALNGAPGIYSARYAGEPCDTERNIDHLLSAMADVPESQRQAYFYCTMVFLRHPEDPVPLIFSGRWDGHILFERQGTKGFGYDPVFFVPTHGCTAAELALAEKNHISHRGQALAQLCTAFQ